MEIKEYCSVDGCSFQKLKCNFYQSGVNSPFHTVLYTHNHSTKLMAFFCRRGYPSISTEINGETTCSAVT